MSLLDDARNLKRRTVSVEEMIEVAIAWLKDEVTLTQVAKTLGTTCYGVQGQFATALKRAFETGRLKEVRK